MKYVASMIALGCVLAGCGYTPSDLEENLPQIEDADADRDFVVFGPSELRKSDGDNNTICTVEQDVLGWVETEEEVTIAGCQGCGEVYTLALTTTDGSNCHSVGGIPTVALLPYELLEVADPAYYEGTQDWVPTGATGTAVFFAATNWIPTAGQQTDYEPRALLFEKEEYSGLDYEREFFLFSRYRYGDGTGNFVGWTADLRFTR